MLNQIVTDLIEGRDITTDQFGMNSNWDLKTATAAVLYSVIEVDHSIKQTELEKMYLLLAQAFGSSQSEIGALFERAENLYGKREAFEKFIGLLNEYYSDEQRQTVYDMIWQIIRADNKVEQHEAALAKLLSHRLGLDKTSSGETKVNLS